MRVQDAASLSHCLLDEPGRCRANVGKPCWRKGTPHGRQQTRAGETKCRSNRLYVFACTTLRIGGCAEELQEVGELNKLDSLMSFEKDHAVGLMGRTALAFFYFAGSRSPQKFPASPQFSSCRSLPLHLRSASFPTSLLLFALI